MGYTHYWYRTNEFTDSQWTDFIAGVKTITERTSPKLVYESTEPRRKPRIDDVTVRFNGSGKEGHETFQIKNFVPTGDNFDFCKTARKPYDLAVTACLAYLDSIYPDAIDVSSDGNPNDWAAGVALAREVWPAVADQIDVPRKVRNEEEDTGGYRD